MTVELKQDMNPFKGVEPAMQFRARGYGPWKHMLAGYGPTPEAARQDVLEQLKKWNEELQELLRVTQDFKEDANETSVTHCPYDTDGDGDCHLCYKVGGCENYQTALKSLAAQKEQHEVHTHSENK